MNYSSAFAIAENFALAYKMHYVFFLLPPTHIWIFHSFLRFFFSRLFFSCKVLGMPAHDHRKRIKCTSG